MIKAQPYPRILIKLTVHVNVHRGRGRPREVGIGGLACQFCPKKRPFNGMECDLVSDSSIT